jgi:3-oxoacyl-[acyl-carrier protein] reductase
MKLPVFRCAFWVGLAWLRRANRWVAQEGGTRSGLTGFVEGPAREQAVAGSNATVNNLLPGAFDTERLRALLDVDARQIRLQQIPAARFGDSSEFGKLCAFLCSVQAVYVTGQNILIDGGAYPGTF